MNIIYIHTASKAKVNQPIQDTSAVAIPQLTTSAVSRSSGSDGSKSRPRRMQRLRREQMGGTGEPSATHRKINQFLYIYIYIFTVYYTFIHVYIYNSNTS
jgi:hypothetical protein